MEVFGGCSRRLNCVEPAKQMSPVMRTFVENAYKVFTVLCYDVGKPPPDQQLLDIAVEMIFVRRWIVWVH